MQTLEEPQQKSKTDVHIVYIGENGFPIGFASIQRLILLCRSIVTHGGMATVICRKGTLSESKGKALPLHGIIEGIDYIYTSGNNIRPATFLNRIIDKIKGIRGEYKKLKELRRTNSNLFLILSCYGIQHVIRYQLWSWWHGVPIVVNHVEMVSQIMQGKPLRLKWNAQIYDHLLLPYVSAALPISNYLEEDFKKIAPNKPVYKVPIICDFKRFEVPSSPLENPYFCYCGGLEYNEVILFILDAYVALGHNHNYHLSLILGGGREEVYDRLCRHIDSLGIADRIMIHRNVEDAAIPIIYRDASALLIPLRNTVQDIARFPHKIGEYLASGNPIITTQVGEIKNYFRDMDNAIVTEAYDLDAFSNKMQFVIDNPDIAKKIGEQGKIEGQRNFDYPIIGKQLIQFLDNLSTNKAKAITAPLIQMSIEKTRK